MVLDSLATTTVSQAVASSTCTSSIGIATITTIENSAKVDGTGEIQCSNLRARALSEREADYEAVKRRLENIDFCRKCNDPHMEIDKRRTSGSKRARFTRKRSLLRHKELRTIDKYNLKNSSP